MKKYNIFVDMDGVLAKQSDKMVDYMYTENWFLNRPSMNEMIEVVKMLLETNHNVYILSSVIDSPYVINEKNKWLNKYLPEMKNKNRLFVPYKVSKIKYVKQYIDTNKHKNVLIDDFTKNLVDWKAQGEIPIKVLNGLNSNNGTWLSCGGDYIVSEENPNKTLNKIFEIADTF